MKTTDVQNCRLCDLILVSGPLSHLAARPVLWGCVTVLIVSIQSAIACAQINLHFFSSG
jgi:hypothetical protein